MYVHVAISYGIDVKNVDRCKKCSRGAYSNCCPSSVSSVVTGVKSVGSIEWICLTCDSN